MPTPWTLLECSGPQMLVIELWFQFEVYAFLPAVSLLPRVALFLLLSSHYVWFVVGVAEFFVDVGPRPKRNARAAGHWGFPTDFLKESRRRLSGTGQSARVVADEPNLKADAADAAERARAYRSGL